MCILIHVTPEGQPHIDREDFEWGCVANPDGFGYAIMPIDRSTIEVGWSMKAHEALDAYLADLERLGPSWSIFHARIATHGTVDLANCHPFFVGGDKQMVLAHNGILPIDADRVKGRSDTAIFAEDWIPGLGVEALDNPEIVKLIENWIRGNKVVVLNASDKLRDPVYFLNEDAGHWRKGIWYSNWSYCTSYNTYAMGGGGWTSEGEYWSRGTDWRRFTSDDETASYEVHADGTVIERYNGADDRRHYLGLVYPTSAKMHGERGNEVLGDPPLPENGRYYSPDEIKELVSYGWDVEQCEVCSTHWMIDSYSPPQYCEDCNTCMACGSLVGCDCEWDSIDQEWIPAHKLEHRNLLRESGRGEVDNVIRTLEHEFGGVSIIDHPEHDIHEIQGAEMAVSPTNSSANNESEVLA